MSQEGAYELFKKGSDLLDKGDFMAAAVPLERARELEPDKGSIREALGRAYFRSARFEQAAEEFAAVVERYPVTTTPTSASGARSRTAGAAPRRASTLPSLRACAPIARTTRPSATASAPPNDASGVALGPLNGRVARLSYG